MSVKVKHPFDLSLFYLTDTGFNMTNLGHITLNCCIQAFRSKHSITEIVEAKYINTLYSKHIVYGPLYVDDFT